MNRFTTTKLTVSAIVTLLAALMMSSRDSVVGQDKTVTTYRGSSVMVRSYDEIPEATEECSPEEKQWWDTLRKAGNDFQKKLDKKSHTKFAELFSHGLGKGYRVPVKDRPPQVLLSGRPVFPDSLIPRLRMQGKYGSIELSIEYRADGSIGEVILLKGLDKELDKYVVQAARQNIFIPAIKDGAFVTDWQPGGFKFSSQRN